MDGLKWGSKIRLHLYLFKEQYTSFSKKNKRYMYTLLYLKWITNRDLLNSTENSAQCYAAAWMMGGEFGGEWICVYVWLSLFTIHLKSSQHCLSDIPQYEKKKKEPKFKIAWIINSEDIHCISLILKHQNSSRYTLHLSSPSDPFSNQKM